MKTLTINIPDNVDLNAGELLLKDENINHKYS